MTSIREHTTAERASSRRSAGFTLVEVMVTLVIAAILAGISIPTIIPMWQQQRTVERQANAELVYTTAQNNMAKLKAEGRLADGDDNGGAVQAVLGRSALASKTAAAPQAQDQAQKDDSSLIVLSSDNDNAKDALELLVPGISGQVSDVGFGGLFHASHPHYCVEVNPTTGYVYGAFYSEDESDCDYSEYDHNTSESASARRGDSAALASMHVAYYGGGVPISFEPTKDTPVSWVGYFEFAKNGDATQATAGYYYQVNEDNSVSDNATDKLHNGNTITEGAVDSSDGTAYGVLVSKRKVDNHEFTVPSDVYSEPYSVQISDGFGVSGINASDLDCYFYKLESPNAPEDHMAKYTVQYMYYNQGGEWLGPSSTHKALRGSTARVTTDDLRSDGYNAGGIWDQIQNQHYKINLDKSNLSGTVSADGSLTLKVYLTNENDTTNVTTTIPESGGSVTSSSNGIATWYPWATSGNSSLAGVAFHVNQNFAGVISKGANSTESGAYQVRTDDQLQHIGVPYGASSTNPVTAYLSDTFYQTHDISINQTWYPIGQEQADGASSPSFSGRFYGGYSGYSSENHSNISAPATNRGQFKIAAVQGFKFNTSKAYSSTVVFTSYGLFGYVTGTISHANLDIETDVVQRFSNPHYGTMAGDLRGSGSVEYSAVSIADSGSLQISQISPEGDAETAETGSTDGKADITTVGGFCGSMTGGARISHSELTVFNSATGSADRAEQSANAQFQLVSKAGWQSSQETNTGGFVGRADCDSSSFISDSSLSLNGPTQIIGYGTSSGIGRIGGFVAASLGNGSISGCNMSITSSIQIGSGNDPGSWDQTTVTGGFVGAMGSREANSISEAPSNAPEITDATLTIANTGSMLIDSTYGGGTLFSGGFVGRMLEKSSLQNNNLVDNGSLTVTGSSGYGESFKSGGFVGEASTYARNASSASQASNIDSCAIKGTGHIEVNIQSSGVQVSAGGFIGSLAQSTTASNSSIKLDGDIAVTSSDSKQASNNIGGFAGSLADSARISSPSVHSTKGHVTVSGSSSTSGQQSIGGIIGCATSNMSLANAALQAGHGASITASAVNNDAYAGGIIGYASEATAAIEKPRLTLGGVSSISASSSKDRYAGGIIGCLAKGATLDSPIVSSTGDTSVSTENAGNAWGTSYSGGLVGYAMEGSTINAATVSAPGSTSITSKGQANAYSGGLVGSADSTTINDVTATYGNSKDAADQKPDVSATESGSGTFTLQSTSDDDACVGGLVARANQTTIGKAKIVLHKGMQAKALSKQSAYIGGLIARSESTSGEYLSLEESPASKASGSYAISLSTGSRDGASPQNNFIGGVIGHMSGGKFENSYIATRNASLDLSSDAKGYAGGFAGYISWNRSDNEHAINRCFVSADIVSSADTVSGFVDRFTNDEITSGTLLENNYVIGSMTGSTSDDNTYAFARTIASPALVRGNYAAVTDSEGKTPYKFADKSTSDDLSKTERCFVYRNNMTSYTDEKNEAGDGAHPASYAYLAHGFEDGQKERVPWDSDFRSNTVLDYIGQDGEKSSYQFHAGSKAIGDSGSFYGLTGSNPFPTATKDKDGEYVNYGKWIAEPRGTD